MIALSTDRHGVATLQLARPEKHNALSQDLIDALRSAADRLAADPSVRVVILAATGKSFCSGGDLGWMQDQIAADAAQKRQAARSIAEMLGALDRLPQPLIGKIHGNAFGGGVGLACVCDLAIAADHATFGLTETKLGLIPATIGPYVAARLGAAKARQVFMSSRVFDAQEAVSLGVVAKSVPAADLDAAVAAAVAPYLSCAPGAVAAAKALLRGFAAPIDADVIDASINALIACWDGDEAEEGISAFFEKRSPSWVTKP